MKLDPATLRLTPRSTIGLVLLFVLTLNSSGAACISAAQLPLNRFSQETRAPGQKPSSDEALAEALQLSLTVVRLFKEGKYDEALPLAKRALELDRKSTRLNSSHESTSRMPSSA